MLIRTLWQLRQLGRYHRPLALGQVTPRKILRDDERQRVGKLAYPAIVNIAKAHPTWSNRKIARVAGVGETTVRRTVQKCANGAK